MRRVRRAGTGWAPRDGGAKILDSGSFSMCMDRFCRIVLVAALAAGWGLLDRPRAALAEVAVYVVSAVPVDVTAATAAVARETAVAEGHRAALARVEARAASPANAR